LLDFLAKRKNSSFPERKPTVSASGKKDFPDGNSLKSLINTGGTEGQILCTSCKGLLRFSSPEILAWLNLLIFNQGLSFHRGQKSSFLYWVAGEARLSTGNLIMENILKKLADQLNSLDEASLISLWDKYYEKVQKFTPSREWEEDILILSLIQSVRWKNQLFNHCLVTQNQEKPVEEDKSVRPVNRSKVRKSGKVLDFRPRE
jgi:hypothetical protein